MAPEAQQHFLRGILRVRSIHQKRMREAVDLITMPLAQDSEFNLTNHNVIAYNAPQGGIVTSKNVLFERPRAITRFFHHGVLQTHNHQQRIAQPALTSTASGAGFPLEHEQGIHS